MPSITVSKQIFSIAAVSTSQLTLATYSSSSNLSTIYQGMTGYAVGPAGDPASTPIVIHRVVSSGIVVCRQITVAGQSGTELDFTAYDGGKIYLPEQVVSVEDPIDPAVQTALDAKADLVGGKVPDTELPAASGAGPGLMSAANFTKLGAFAAPGWRESFYALAAVYAPGATEFQERDYGGALVIETGTAGSRALATANPLQTEGGGFYVDAGVWTRFTNTILLDPKNKAWAIGIDCKLGVPASGAQARNELQTVANTAPAPSVAFGHLYGLGGDAETKYYIACVDAGGTAGDPTFATVASDGERHLYVLTYDKTALRLFEDGVLICTSTDIGHIPVATQLCLRMIAVPSDVDIGVSRAIWATEPA